MTAELAVGATSATQFGLQVAALICGGGIIQLVIFLLKRRAELSVMDRTSAKPLLEEQGAFIDRLSAAETRALAKVRELEDRLTNQNVDFARSMAQVTHENSRMAADLATVRTDLDIALRQVAELRRQLAAGP